MLKIIAAIGFVALGVAACGGGGDGNSAAPTTKTMKLSLYGQPLVKSATSAHAQAIPIVSAASSATATNTDATATVSALQAALIARGVTADVTAQVMDGTTLHQIVMGENNGLPPTPDQFKTDPSGYLIVNFQLDDMVTPWSDPAQVAAVQQFVQDLTVFSQRASVSGKLVYAVVPIQTCDGSGGAAYALQSAIIQASQKTLIGQIGAIPFNVAFGPDGKPLASPDLVHLGADCRTPDAYLLDMRTNAIADYIAALYKESAGTAAAASGASATGT
ncbi:hypothetical protein PQQ81_01205 [Paraburkholderia strydomiana]|uniref:hypothetical protein n=1 Tax=Paraburkholderia strydomiana TaxID=1245417 RepID=UPI0038B6B63B